MLCIQETHLQLAFEKQFPLILQAQVMHVQDEARCTMIEETISRLCLSVEIQEFRDEQHEANMSKNMDRLKSLKAQSVNAVTDFKREVRDLSINCNGLHIEKQASSR